MPKNQLISPFDKTSFPLFSALIQNLWVHKTRPFLNITAGKTYPLPGEKGTHSVVPSHRLIECKLTTDFPTQNTLRFAVIAESTSNDVAFGKVYSVLGMMYYFPEETRVAFERTDDLVVNIIAINPTSSQRFTQEQQYTMVELEQNLNNHFSSSTT